MKNFFKKLSFVLAIAMVLTSVVPATTASAASKVQIELNGKAVTEVTAFFGGVVRNLDASKNGKAASGTWKVGNTKVATVDSKTGVITPVGEGTTKVAFTLKGEKKASASVLVKVRTRAAALHVYDPSEYATGTRNKLEDTTIELNVGEDKELKVTMPISKKASNAGAKIATYFLYADSSNEDVVKVSASTKMYTRAVTLKPVAAGEATVTLFANQTTKANARANKYVKEAKFTVKVAGESKIASAEAVKVNQVEVKFNGAADKDTVIALSKAGNAVEHTVAWNEDRTVATLTTTAKMTNGTYQVTATVAEAKSEATFEVVSQYVKEIVFLNDVALTGLYKGGNKNVVPATDLEAGYAFVYYKVLDQYGEDLTASTSIQWSSSAEVVDKDRNLGKITLARSDSKDFTYGEQIFISAVYNKTGVNKSTQVTVGTKQNLDTVEIKGFVKKNTTEIVGTLPNGFKSGEYYLVFDALDQNGNALTPDTTKYTFVNGESATFISDAPLLVKEFAKGGAGKTNTLVIEGHTYNAIEVVPGQFVDKGGEFNVTVIANNTGKKSVKNFVVGVNQILTSFELLDPTATVLADGETWAIPFTALDQDGKEITNFDTLARNLNKITFTASEGTAKLKENDDRTATLLFTDKTIAWTDSQSTDGVDRTVSVTSVVVGGNSSNLMMYIQDKARPEAVFEEGMSEVYLEGDGYIVGKYDIVTWDATNSRYKVANTVRTLKFLDQYGRKMVDPYGNTTDAPYAFFEASNGGALKGNDFSGYVFDVQVEYKGSTSIKTIGTVGNTYSKTDSTYNTTYTKGIANDTEGVAKVIPVTNDKFLLGLSTYNTNINTKGVLTEGTGYSAIEFGFATDTKTAYNGQVLTYSIVKKKTDIENVSTQFNKSYAVVDLTQVKNFTVGDVDVVGAAGSLGKDSTTLTQFVPASNITSTFLSGDAKTYLGLNGKVVNNFGAGSKVVVTGKYNGKDVNVPANYFKLSQDGTLVYSASGGYGDQNLGAVSESGILVSYLYDVKSANYVRKDFDTTIKVVISEAYANGAVSGTALGLGDSYGPLQDSYVRDTVTKAVKVSDAAEVLTKVVLPESHTFNPTNTAFSGLDVYGDIAYNALYWWSGILYTQYGKDVTYDSALSFKVSDIVEAEGYADGNFTVSGNDSNALKIEGAEIGDTFTLTITATYGAKLSKAVKIVVGADKNANITNDVQNYRDTLVGTTDKPGTLETQRQATLE